MSSVGPAGRVTSIRFRAGIGGEPVTQETENNGPLAFKPTPWGAWLWGGPDYPAPGRPSAVKVGVGVGCCAEIRSVEATVAGRGRVPEPWGDAPAASSVGITATVGSDGVLTWALEPGVATEGGDHRVDATVQLAGSARLLWRDDFMIDRHEHGVAGTWHSRLRVSRDGWPVVASDLAVGPGSPLWDSPAVLNGAPAVTYMVVVDPEQPAGSWTSARALAGAGSATGVALPLAAAGVQLLAWGDDLRSCREVLEELVERSGVPGWALTRWNARRPVDRTEPLTANS